VPALHYLESIARGESIRLGHRVVVIGGGNAAIDSARTALRGGADVTVIYRRERKDMPAIDEETIAAEEEGVTFLFLAAPHRILGDEGGTVKAIELVKTRLGEFDTSGRRKPIPTGEIQRLDCDSVIFAIGETLDREFASGSGLRLQDSGTIDVNRFTLATSRPKFYAGGDAVTGASNVSGAMAYGKRAAREIARQLMEIDRWDDFANDLACRQVPPEEPSPNARHEGRMLDPAVRCRSSAEVVAGLTAEEALDEANRCLRCDLTAANIS
jgi:NADPH-dependent glutamate synthase beta subunit-like oxidoreductase